ncbi:MAG: SDR family oxidoreductase [Chloroflexota bacterium]|nr:SDR family oxidoreductase [Chloroflexota bacterium]
MSRRFDGRVVMVTGSTGMAASAARALTSEGASVFVTSRTPANAETLGAELGGGWMAADLAREEDADAAVRACIERHGRLDALYAVAGISGRRIGDGPLHEMSLAGWQTVMTNNATSLFLVTRAAIQRMLAQEAGADGSRGVLLAMSSALARHPSPVHFATHAYAASKGAIESFTRAVAAAYAPQGIRMNAIAPSLVATPMSERAQSDPAIVAYLRQKQPLAGGPIHADAITPVALHLLSGDARMITGQVIEVDAGWSVSEPEPPRPA